MSEVKEQQSILLTPLLSGPNKGKEVKLSNKHKRDDKHWVDGERHHNNLIDGLVDSFIHASTDTQHSVIKQLNSKVYNKSFRKLFSHVDSGLAEEAAALILHNSSISVLDVEEFIGLCSAGEVVNVDEIQLDGAYSLNHILPSKCSQNVFKSLIKLGCGRHQSGPGEYALSLMSKRIKAESKGDIDIDGKLFELKVNGGRLSDIVGPQPTITRAIVDGALDISEFTTKGVSLRQLVNRVNSTRMESRLGIHSMIQKLYDSILPGYAHNMANVFRDGHVNYDKALEQFTLDNFNWYKSSKEGTDGEWDTLIGINTNNAGSVGVASTAESFNNLPKYASSPAVICSGASAGREYYIDFFPKHNE